MDSKKVDSVWNEFADLKNVELKFQERNRNQIQQSNYLVNYTDDIAIYSFIGILTKSDDGTSSDKTSIIIEFLARLAIDNFELEVKSKFKSFFSSSNDLEKIISKSLRKLNGKNFTFKENFIRIDVDYIFSSKEAFEIITDLVSKIKNIH